MATKYEYLVINLDRRELPDDVTESDQMSSILNRHGARGWQLDRFWDSDDGFVRFFLLRKDTTKAIEPERKIVSF